MATFRSGIPRLVSSLEQLGATAPRDSARRVVAGAKRRSRVDSGEMRAGWQMVRIGKNQYLVFNPVRHTIYNEFGTRHMAPQPMLAPAVAEEGTRFFVEAAAMVKKAIKEAEVRG